MQTCVLESPVGRSCRPPNPSAAAHLTFPTATPIYPKERSFPALPNASSSCRQHHKPVALPVEVQHPAVLLPHSGFFKEALQVLTSESSPQGSPQSTFASQTSTSGQQRQQELGKGQKKHIKNTSPGLTVHTVPICCLGWNGNGNLQSWVVGQTLELGWRRLHRKQHLPCPRSSFSEDFVCVTLHTAAPIAEHTLTTILLVPKGSLQES